jgi:hypothetical protein
MTRSDEIPNPPEFNRPFHPFTQVSRGSDKTIKSLPDFAKDRLARHWFDVSMVPQSSEQAVSTKQVTPE